MTLSGLVEYVRRLSAPGKIQHGFSLGVAGSFKLLLAAMLCCGANRANAAISTLTETVSLSPQLAAFSGVPVGFQKFDPSLGKLSSVQIILQGTGEFTQRYENMANQHDTARMRQSLDLILTLPNSGQPFLKAHQVEKHRYSADAFDGVIDFDGSSGKTGVYGVTAENEKVLSSRNNLALFTGSGLADIFLSTRAPFHISGVGQSSAFEAMALTGVDITVIYSFISAPEPAWYGLLAGGLALIAIRAARVRNPSEIQQ